MALDFTKLDKVVVRGNKTTARCPACAEEGMDSKGEHLVIYESGKFACVIHPGEQGKSHRRRVFELAGHRDTKGPSPCPIRVRRALECLEQPSVRPVRVF